MPPTPIIDAGVKRWWGIVRPEGLDEIGELLFAGDVGIGRRRRDDRLHYGAEGHSACAGTGSPLDDLPGEAEVDCIVLFGRAVKIE